MDIKKFKTIFLILITILAVLEIMFFVKVLFSDSEGFEWGSVTDWVSALCNVAMASAAVYAALQAKKWFSQHSYSAAFNKAAEFLNKIDSEKSAMSDLYYEVQTLDDFFQRYEPNTGHPLFSDLAYYDDRVEYYNQKAFDILKLKNEYNFLSRWPITLSNEFLISDILNSLQHISTLSAASFSTGKSAYMDKEQMDGTQFNPLLDDLKHYFRDIQLHLHDLDERYANYTQKSFSDFFTSK